MKTNADLVLTLPSDGSAERTWAARAVFGCIFGAMPRLQDGTAGSCRLTLGDQAGQITWPDRILPQLDRHWLATSSGAFPARNLDTPDGGIIVHDIEAGDQLLSGGPMNQRLGLDLLGGAFLLMSRYEEALEPRTEDSHGRFLASATWAGAARLHRPIVDEWVAVLRDACRRCWPGWRPPPPTYRVWLSCDVDHPSTALAIRPRPSLLREAAADVMHRHDPLLGLRRLARCLIPGLRDPYDTFAMMEGLGRAHGLDWTFTVMLGGRKGPYEAAYSLSEPSISRMLEWMHEHGHAIGLHASYAAGDDPSLLTGEVAGLRSALDRLGPNASIGGRHHYLRCRPDLHWPAWDAAGATWESSMGFPDHIGFRCGTAHAFPAFDLHRRHALNLQVRPLVAMDQALLTEPGGAALATTRLANTIRRTGGCLSMLWHNSTVAGRRQRHALAAALQAACGHI